MARYASKLTESLGMEIYNRYVDYSVENDGVLPPYVFWQAVLVDIDGYPISKGGFAHWLNRLQVPQRPGEAPYIWRDQYGVWHLRHVDILKIVS